MTRTLGREYAKDGTVYLRFERGLSAIVADGTKDGDGWTFAVLDDDGNVIVSGVGYKNARLAKHAARQAVS